MTTAPNKQLPRETLSTDRAALVAIKTMRSYAPANTAITTESLVELEQLLRAAEEEEILAERARANKRAARNAAAWKLHNAMLSAKAAVLSQFGPDSDEVEAMGLKRKSEYRRPERRRTTD